MLILCGLLGMAQLHANPHFVAHAVSWGDSVKYSDAQLVNESVWQEASQYFIRRAVALYGENNFFYTTYGSPFCVALLNKQTYNCTKVIFFNPNDNSVNAEVDIQQLNPYRNASQELGERQGIIQQLVGENYRIAPDDDTQLPVKPIWMPDALQKNVPPNYPIYAVHISTHIIQAYNKLSVSQEPLIVWFGYSLLPPEEILEHRAYPGLTTIVVLDGQTGKVISIHENLPFVVSNAAVSATPYHLVVTHLPPIEDNLIYTEAALSGEYWRHGVSIYTLDSSLATYQAYCLDEFFVDKHSGVGLIHFGYTTDPENRTDWVHSIIKDGQLYNFHLLNSYSFMTADGVSTTDGFKSFESYTNVKPLISKE